MSSGKKKPKLSFTICKDPQTHGVSYPDMRVHIGDKRLPVGSYSISFPVPEPRPAAASSQPPPPPDTIIEVDEDSINGGLCNGDVSPCTTDSDATEVIVVERVQSPSLVSAPVMSPIADGVVSPSTTADTEVIVEELPSPVTVPAPSPIADEIVSPSTTADTEVIVIEEPPSPVTVPSPVRLQQSVPKKRPRPQDPPRDLYHVDLAALAASLNPNYSFNIETPEQGIGFNSFFAASSVDDSLFESVASDDVMNIVPDVPSEEEPLYTNEDSADSSSVSNNKVSDSHNNHEHVEPRDSEGDRDNESDSEPEYYVEKLILLSHKLIKDDEKGCIRPVKRYFVKWWDYPE